MWDYISSILLTLPLVFSEASVGSTQLVLAALQMLSFWHLERKDDLCFLWTSYCEMRNVASAAVSVCLKKQQYRPLTLQFRAHTHIHDIKERARTPSGCPSSLDYLSCFVVKPCVDRWRNYVFESPSLQVGVWYPIGSATCHHIWSHVCTSDKPSDTCKQIPFKCTHLHKILICEKRVQTRKRRGGNELCERTGYSCHLFDCAPRVSTSFLYKKLIIVC